VSRAHRTVPRLLLAGGGGPAPKLSSSLSDKPLGTRRFQATVPVAQSEAKDVSYIAIFDCFDYDLSIELRLGIPIMTQASTFETTLPVEREVAAAVEGQRALAAYLATQFETQHIQIFDENNQAHQVELPTSALRLLVDILSELAEGNAVKVVPIHAELTTQEAADMLNVSRPHLVKLLEGGALPFHKTGKHRRIRFADLMSFKAERDRASARAMEELAKQAQELQLGCE